MLKPPRPAPTATAVLIQPNLDVAGSGLWMGSGEWDRHIADFARLAAEQCKTYIAGIPQTGAPTAKSSARPIATHPDLIAWPESPAPFFEDDARFQKALVGIARANHAPLVVGNIGMEFPPSTRRRGTIQLRACRGRGRRSAWAATTKSTSSPSASTFPSAVCSFLPASSPAKFRRSMRGDERKVFRSSRERRHRYGVFICYEAVFADEVRQFARNSAPRCWSTSATTDGTATPARPGST